MLHDNFPLQLKSVIKTMKKGFWVSFYFHEPANSFYFRPTLGNSQSVDRVSLRHYVMITRKILLLLHNFHFSTTGRRNQKVGKSRVKGRLWSASQTTGDAPEAERKEFERWRYDHSGCIEKQVCALFLRTLHTTGGSAFL